MEFPTFCQSASSVHFWRCFQLNFVSDEIVKSATLGPSRTRGPGDTLDRGTRNSSSAASAWFSLYNFDSEKFSIFLSDVSSDVFSECILSITCTVVGNRVLLFLEMICQRFDRFWVWRFCYISAILGIVFTVVFVRLMVKSYKWLI